MKKILMSMVIIGLLSFITQPTQQEKKFKFEFSQSEVIGLYNSMRFAIEAMQTSQAPAASVNSASHTLDSMSKLIVKQYNEAILEMAKEDSAKLKTSKEPIKKQ